MSQQDLPREDILPGNKGRQGEGKKERSFGAFRRQKKERKKKRKNTAHFPFKLKRYKQEGS